MKQIRPRVSEENYEEVSTYIGSTFNDKLSSMILAKRRHIDTINKLDMQIELSCEMENESNDECSRWISKWAETDNARMFWKFVSFASIAACIVLGAFVLRLS